MGLLSKDRMLAAGLSTGEASAIEDQVTGLGLLATPPSGGGTSMTLGGNIFEFFSNTGVGNGADTTEDTLKTFSLPANALDQAGRQIWIYAHGSYANNTNTKAAKLYFGATSIAAATGQNVAWACEMLVGKDAANSQVISGQTISGTTHGGCSYAHGTETDTAAITIKVTGQDSTSANANAIVLKGLIVAFNN